ncbi:hypothetical protein QAD02_013888 [Eretmocerus hayati]|uniref:Uncharacterized protein n=1 Tax=Eretmocerus hayati TaxID=131215 RepID=A0ACC2P5I0_9HYME|nr:hypothetical protein QAD02_013888 [Eretmocerus hayati]
MNDKIAKSAAKNRQRVQEHREKKKLKLESSTPSTLEGINSGVEDEMPPCELENQSVSVPHDESSKTNLEMLVIRRCQSKASDNDRQIKMSHAEPSDESDGDSENSNGECSENCGSAVTSFADKIKKWASSDVSFTKVTELLKILNEHHPEIPTSTKTLLKTDLHLSQRIRRFNVPDPSDTSEYVYFGIACHLMKIVNISLHKESVLRLKINVDGMTPFTSSSVNFWPILGLVHHEAATYKPFVIAAYFGKGKPFSVHLYMVEFIQELNHLYKEGIIIDDRKFKIRIKCFCCDRPARAFLKCIVNHEAYYACEHCWVIGFQYLGRTVYPSRECSSRLDASFRNKENFEHHDGTSPLLQLIDSDGKPIDMIVLFMQEFMHAGPHGIMKKLLLEQWFSDDTKITRGRRTIGSLRLKNLAGQVPKELQRVSRDLNNLSLLKAKDFRLLLLHCGPLVFKDVVSDEQYNHFLLLHVACRILHSRDLITKFGSYTKVFLDRFVLLCEHIYGLEFVVLNPHILSHLYEDVENINCPVTYLDEFIFEGYLSELKKSLRSGNRPLAQLCQKVEFDMEFNSKKAVSNIDLLILNHNESENLHHVSRLKYLNFELTIKKPDNIIVVEEREKMSHVGEEILMGGAIIMSTRYVPYITIYIYSCSLITMSCELLSSTWLYSLHHGCDKHTLTGRSPRH